MKIDLVKGNIEDVALVNALVGYFGDDKFFDEVEPDVSVVDVLLTVNGKQVPFDLVVRDVASQLRDIQDDQVIKRALQLLSLAGLDDLKDTIRLAREKVEMSLEEIIRRMEK